MKKILLFLFLFIGQINNISAQSKSIKVLLQQIVALQVYIDAAQKGYSIARKGLNTVGDLKRGELNLHTVYLNSLKVVNPRIKNYIRVAEIIDLQWKIMKEYKSLFSDVKEVDLFNNKELEYIKRVLDRLINDCSDTLNELVEVTTNGELEMKDDERLKRIDKLYVTMEDSYHFFQSFKKQLKGLHFSRRQEVKEAHESSAVYGILKE
ncbi:hypothetical protein ACYE2N_00435 [Flavobacterium sp. MAHUQ-51]|uniref:hypothetical protein n=1 Tax=Flavobacterium sp. GCM10022190 TaxID=3252639 RepID=UPI00362101CE